MSFYRKAKLSIDSFRNLTSKFVNQRSPKDTIQKSIHPLKPPCLDSAGKTNSRFNTSPTSYWFASKPSFQIGGGKQSYNTSWQRFYYVDRYQVKHFKRRGPKRWFQNPRHLVVAVVVGAGVVISVYYGNLETVPYTNRTHFILLSPETEKRLGEMEFENLKASMKTKILPSIHPVSVRVRLIAKDVIDALKRGIKQERVWSDLGYGSDISEKHEENTPHTLNALIGGVEKVSDEGWRRDEEILDDTWVQESREKGHSRGLKPATRHLEGLNWEVVVIDEPVVNAFCLPGGKIVVFTGLLQHFPTDAEIATIIGHEVGHSVARHAAEGLTRNMWFTIIQLILLQFIFMPDLVNAMSHLLLRLPFSRRMELEADYIGLLLMASAGYDPRVAPMVYEKLGRVSGDSALRDYLSTHPSGKRRAQLLAQAKVMEEAVAIYKEAHAGRGVLGFL